MVQQRIYHQDRQATQAERAKAYRQRKRDALSPSVTALSVTPSPPRPRRNGASASRDDARLVHLVNAALKADGKKPSDPKAVLQAIEKVRAQLPDSLRSLDQMTLRNRYYEFRKTAPDWILALPQRGFRKVRPRKERLDGRHPGPPGTRWIGNVLYADLRLKRRHIMRSLRTSDVAVAAAKVALLREELYADEY
jgi:hypothetical protein